MFSYIGGKSKIGSWIQEYIPNDIDTYVENFSGAFWVYFNLDLDKFKNLKTVVYNDFNPLNSNLFACIKQYKDFHNYIKDIPAQEKDRFIDYQKHCFNSDFKFDVNVPNFQLGLEYIYVVTQVFSGSKPETSNFIDLKGKYKSKFLTFKDKLNNPKWIEYIKKINAIENLDFEQCTKKYDGPNTYNYNDPPYYKTEKYYSKHDFGKEDHERLSNTLKSMKGKFSLSYYYFNELNNWYPKDKFNWQSKEFSKASMAKSGKEQTKGIELLIMNY
jgi:DNA adenine methylase